MRFPGYATGSQEIRVWGEAASFRTFLPPAHFHENHHARGRAQRTMEMQPPSIGTPSRRPAGAAMLQKFLGMGVRGKGPFSKRPFPPKLHFHRKGHT